MKKTGCRVCGVGCRKKINMNFVLRAMKNRRPANTDYWTLQDESRLASPYTLHPTPYTLCFLAIKLAMALRLPPSRKTPSR